MKSNSAKSHLLISENDRVTPDIENKIKKSVLVSTLQALFEDNLSLQKACQK